MCQCTRGSLAVHVPVTSWVAFAAVMLVMPRQTPPRLSSLLRLPVRDTGHRWPLSDAEQPHSTAFVPTAPSLPPAVRHALLCRPALIVPSGRNDQACPMVPLHQNMSTTAPL